MGKRMHLFLVGDQFCEYFAFFYFDKGGSFTIPCGFDPTHPFYFNSRNIYVGFDIHHRSIVGPANIICITSIYSRLVLVITQF